MTWTEIEEIAAKIAKTERQLYSAHGGPLEAARLDTFRSDWSKATAEIGTTNRRKATRILNAARKNEGI